jgi:hypothetical protein
MVPQKKLLKAQCGQPNMEAMTIPSNIGATLVHLQGLTDDQPAAAVACRWSLNYIWAAYGSGGLRESTLQAWSCCISRIIDLCYRSSVFVQPVIATTLATDMKQAAWSRTYGYW